MPLLIILRHLSRGLPGRAGASGTTQAGPGLLSLPLALLEQDQSESPGRCSAEHGCPPTAEVETSGWERGVVPGSPASHDTTMTLSFFIYKTGVVAVPASEGLCEDVGRESPCYLQCTAGGLGERTVPSTSPGYSHPDHSQGRFYPEPLGGERFFPELSPKVRPVFQDTGTTSTRTQGGNCPPCPTVIQPPVWAPRAHINPLVQSLGLACLSA